MVIAIAVVSQADACERGGRILVDYWQMAKHQIKTAIRTIIPKTHSNDRYKTTLFPFFALKFIHMVPLYKEILLCIAFAI